MMNSQSYIRNQGHNLGVARSNARRHVAPVRSPPLAVRRPEISVRVRPARTLRQRLRRHRFLFGLAALGLIAALVPHAIWLTGLPITEQARWVPSVVGALLVGLSLEYAWVLD
jgi:hypothetical protein